LLGDHYRAFTITWKRGVRAQVPPGGQVRTRPPEQTAGKPEVFARKPEALGCMTLVQLNDNLEKNITSRYEEEAKGLYSSKYFIKYFCDSFLKTSATNRPSFSISYASPQSLNKLCLTPFSQLAPPDPTYLISTFYPTPT
jgi:hypothetical protein